MSGSTVAHNTFLLLLLDAARLRAMALLAVAMHLLGSAIAAITVVAVLLATLGRSLGIRLLIAKTLLRVFEWGSRLSDNPHQRANDGGRDSPGAVIIRRDMSNHIERLLSADKADESTQKAKTVQTMVQDSFIFIAAGVEAIIEDEVTSRFAAEQLASWNLLTRTSVGFEHLNWKLSLLWLGGFLVRYAVLVPCRLVLFGLGSGSILALCLVLPLIPGARVRRWVSRHALLTSMRVFARAFSSIVRFHNPENRARSAGICVANHTSPFDVLLLSCDNNYAMIGQRQPGILTIAQKAFSRVDSHIWFERSEAKDRASVSRRMGEHIRDPTNLPIIIFPEGTCINNTSVMQFKKGSFEIAETVYPIAMKYDARLGNAFWNSSSESFGLYLWRMLTSWAIQCDVWYLPPMRRLPGESAAQFARRVKRAIAEKGGLDDLEWDGGLKRTKVSQKMIEEKRDQYYRRLERTTTIGVGGIDNDELPSIDDNTSILEDIYENDQEAIATEEEDED